MYSHYFPHTFQIRIGIHTGPCMTGVIGSKMPKFSIFGDTMNTASRMESTCVPGRMQVSGSTWELVKHLDNWEATGGITVKGKGIMETYLWAGELPESMPRHFFSSTEDAHDLFSEPNVGGSLAACPTAHIDGGRGSGGCTLVQRPIGCAPAAALPECSGDGVSASRWTGLPPPRLRLRSVSSLGRRLPSSQKPASPTADWTALSCLASSALATTLVRTKSMPSPPDGFAPR